VVSKNADRQRDYYDSLAIPEPGGNAHISCYHREIRR